jgi:hypothetical protein
MHGSLSWMTLDVGRPSPKDAPTLARARLPLMGKPGLRRFCAGRAYAAPNDHLGDAIRASRTLPCFYKMTRNR